MGNTNFASMSKTSVIELQNNLECGLPDMATGWKARTVLQDNLGEDMLELGFVSLDIGMKQLGLVLDGDRKILARSNFL